MNHTQKFLAAAAITFIGASAASAQTIVAAWDGGQGNNAAGDTSVITSALVDSSLGTKGVSSHAWSGKSSTDGTWGTVGTPAAPDNSLGWQVKDGESQTFIIENTSGADLTLASFHFDYADVFDAMTVSLYYDSGDLTESDNTLLGSVTTSTTIGNGNNDWEDANISFAATLTDFVLANADSATFRIDISVAGTGASGLDNIAISIVPEPSSYALISGCFLMGFVALRRRSRS
ncbi:MULTISPECIES: PEP-CTERM sorting domain-containing protein [unclassified Lentimonas]|uniref:PEP-CTERM sorting domain-containing protein n=1 Tax=unclassified Lentimonas TaxID=2630993 RepID=UPI00132B0E87|nr:MULTISPECIES: PEP-CTERM sorting domain-containing protein [unclassified Lentimonas]CAA6679363.1 Unannotated [Lentimonas sp. CC4]CAA6687358.1 Unannotated [Lentimonas sp. CC6]CAA7078030.1 Unannotated [Lentimonas sp. CC4]CAA7168000.1 Unannotated [Lentimonas sp. CC21]CAA7179575.1 Unannotated [Lentimonas sp. CC8]